MKYRIGFKRRTCSNIHKRKNKKKIKTTINHRSRIWFHVFGTFYKFCYN